MTKVNPQNLKGSGGFRKGVISKDGLVLKTKGAWFAYLGIRLAAAALLMLLLLWLASAVRGLHRREEKPL